MNNYREYILALNKCAAEHDNDNTPMGLIRISDLCRDTAELLEKIEQKSTSKNDLGVDAVSRKALIERINHAEENFKADNMESIGSDDGDPFVDGVLSGVFNIREMVIQAPSATPQEPRTGHWIYDNFNWRCSECNETPKTMGYVGTADFMTEHFKFCNHCGAKMVESQESGDKCLA